jgi:RHS repeat-associated protein
MLPSHLSYLYDRINYNSMGNRIAKHVFSTNGTTLERSTYYILDAQGNQISTYDHEIVSETTQFNLKENNIYGSSRIGNLNRNLNVLTSTISNNYASILGGKYYEFSNHLGNVLTVFSDLKIPKDTDNNNVVDGYEIGVVSIADYSPFGVQLDGRTFNSSESRRGFNNMEKDDEVKGKGNSYDFGARMYDSRVGRWWSRDVVVKSNVSPYESFKGNPMIYIDPDGNDDFYFLHGFWWYNKNGRLSIVKDGETSYTLPIADIKDKKPGNHRYFQKTSSIIGVSYGYETAMWNSKMIISKEEMENELISKIMGGVDQRMKSIEIDKKWTVQNGVEHLLISYTIKEHLVIEVNSPRTIMGGDNNPIGYDARENSNHLPMVNEIINDWKGEYWGRSGVISNLGIKSIKAFIDAGKHNGAFDFKTHLFLDDNKLYKIDGVFYNKNEAGNYYFGYAMAALGYSRADAKFIANYGATILDPKRAGDENWELDAVIDGWNRFVNGTGSSGSKINMYEDH